ncbi:MAG: hypothetical protein A2219_08770 [Elusimicrobia bacterium RIFOXYA2_FULL_50_26]|nr:MAG: hypothetical protein A2219_08770 [Elusimicrobia bacterium RIFOXYA2_FULL_50_26]
MTEKKKFVTMNNYFMVKTDCVHFPLDRPCRFHKEHGTKCYRCNSYQPVFSAKKNKPRRILIIKLDAMGDVLRTTFLLPGLKEKYGDIHVTWLVAPASAPFLEHNPLVDCVWPLDKDVFSRLLSETFEEVINLDLSPSSLALASAAPAGSFTGFMPDKKRRVMCSNAYARKWLLMSAFDDAKKSNTQTFQYWMAKITGIKRADYEIHVPLEAAAVARAALFARRHGLAGRKIVGINPGAGARWRLKKWTDPGFASLIRSLEQSGAKALLLGGPQEETLLRSLAKSTGAVAAGTDNTILEFFALINLCDIVVTGDTMALHAALGLKKKAVAIFGPTSAAEIEMYGRGTKIVSPAPCVCCYRAHCQVRPDCMSLIRPGVVRQAVENLWK